MEGLPRNNSDFSYSGTFGEKLCHDCVQGANRVYAAHA